MKTNKFKIIKIILLITFLVNIFCFLPNKNAKAGWPTNDLPSWMDYINTKINEMLVPMLKQKAVKIVHDRMMVLMTGRTNRSLIIADYEDYIFGSAQRDAALFANSFFRSMEGAVSDSTQRMQKIAMESIENEILSVEKTVEKSLSNIDKTLTEGTEDLLNPAKGGGEAALVKTISGGNPLEVNYDTGALVASAMQKAQRTAEAQAIAGGGVDGVKKEGTNLITMPGKILGEMMATAESLPMMITAYADSIPEVAASMAVNIVSGVIDSEIAKVTAPIDNKLANLNKTVTGGINDIKKKIYNGVKFSNSSRKK